MNKKDIKQLAKYSFDTKGNLIEKTVLSITKKLKREDLKKYVKELKKHDKEITLIVMTPTNTNNKALVKNFKRDFGKKKIIIKENKSLVTGIKIIDNDSIYDLSFKNTLEKMVDYLIQ